jgi:hypothetical protein
VRASAQTAQLREPGERRVHDKRGRIDSVLLKRDSRYSCAGPRESTPEQGRARARRVGPHIVIASKNTARRRSSVFDCPTVPLSGGRSGYAQ